MRSPCGRFHLLPSITGLRSTKLDSILSLLNLLYNYLSDILIFICSDKLHYVNLGVFSQDGARRCIIKVLRGFWAVFQAGARNSPPAGRFWVLSGSFGGAPVGGYASIWHRTHDAVENVFVGASCGKGKDERKGEQTMVRVIGRLALCALLLSSLGMAAAEEDMSLEEVRRLAEQEEAAIQSYLGLVFQSLESHKRYPRVAELSGLSGRVVLRFTVRWDGEVLNPEAIELTGHDSFREAALQALTRVGQLPRFPDEIRRRELLVEVPIGYRIEAKSSPGMAVAEDELLTQLRHLAEQGDAQAQNELGTRYDGGNGVLQDFAEAVKWYRRAAEQGHAWGQSNLGSVYAYGRGVPQDSVEAVKWYRMATEQGYALAQNNLGWMYLNGDGMPQDDVEAYAWFNVAAAQGIELAKENREYVAKLMSSEKLGRAQELSREYWEKYVLPFRN